MKTQASVAGFGDYYAWKTMFIYNRDCFSDLDWAYPSSKNFFSQLWALSEFSFKIGLGLIQVGEISHGVSSPK